MRNFAFALAAAGIVVLASQLSAFGPTWPMWRGDGLGVSDETALPTEWNDKSRIAWKTAIPGRAFSSPIVWRNRLISPTRSKAT